MALSEIMANVRPILGPINPAIDVDFFTLRSDEFAISRLMFRSC